MTLLCIREAVVACNPLDEAVAFHGSVFGFDVVGQGEGWALLAMAGTPSGRLRLIEDRDAAAEPAPEVWDVGPRLLGIYSRDLNATRRALVAAGGTCGPLVSYPYGDRTMTEVLGYGRDGVWWTVPGAVEGLHRPSDALEGSDSIHSELHTAVLSVDDHEAALAFFQAGGLDVVFDGDLSGPGYKDLGVPEGATMRLTFMSGPSHRPARLELLSFVDAPATSPRENNLGLKKLVFECDDVNSTRDSLIAAGAEALDDGDLRGPVGIRIGLVESSTL